MVKSLWDFPCGSVVNNPPGNAGDMGLIPGLERSLGEGNGCLGNPTDRGAWWDTVDGVANSGTQLKRLNNNRSQFGPVWPELEVRFCFDKIKDPILEGLYSERQQPAVFLPSLMDELPKVEVILDE